MVEMDRTVAVTVGYRLSGGRLLEQASATRRAALGDLDALRWEGLLREADILNLDALVDVVHASLQDRSIADADARASASEQGSALHELTSDCTRLGHCVRRVFRHRSELSRFPQGSFNEDNVSALCSDLNGKLAFAREHETELAQVGINREYLTKVQARVRALEESARLEGAALASLASSVRSYCENKGRLYFAINDINDAGQALHAADFEAAAKYNLQALYRTAKSKPAEVAMTTPAPVTR